MDINKKNPLPVYQQLKNILISKIQNKELLPGQGVPSERHLSKELNISRMTVRQAFKELESEGHLYREKGRGTFVSKPFFEQKNIMSFTEFVQIKGLTPQTKILLFESIPSSDDLIDIFELSGPEQFFHFKRLRLADDIPIAVEEVFIPARICPRLVKEELTSSLYNLLKDSYNHTITSVKNTISALIPNQEHMKLLGIKRNTPLLSVLGINLDQNKMKLFYESSYYRADEYIYSINISIY